MQLIKRTVQDVRDEYSLLASCLIPVGAEDIQEYKKLKKDEIIFVKISDKPRNYKHHKKLFGLLQFVIDNSDYKGKVEDLLIAVKYETGHSKVIIDFHGVERVVPDSINFDTMGQKTFEEFYNRCLFVLSNYIGVTPEELVAMSEEDIANNC